MRVLLVEDSATMAVYVTSVLSGHADLELLPVARDGERGLEAAQRLAPDVVLMDLQLPKLDGVEVIRRVMETCPTPVIVLSAYLTTPERDRTFEAFQAGAVEVVAKPSGLGNGFQKRFADRLVRLIRVMAAAKVVSRRSSGGRVDLNASPPGIPSCELVLIGSSTGGPPVLFELLERLPNPPPVPILVCQHILPGFERGLAEWLGKTGQPVQVVERSQALRPEVFLAPANRHLVLVGKHLGHREPTGERHVPSVDVLFQSAAAEWSERCAAVLLSGMGRDGAEGMRSLRQRGAMTIAQSRETCVVDGMPNAARKLGAAGESLDPAAIAARLAELIRPNSATSLG